MSEEWMTATDEALFARFRQGESGPLEELVRRYEGPLYRFLVRKVRDSHRAEDLFQQTWMNAIRGRHTYEHPRPFKTWLYAIAHNAARRPGSAQDVIHGAPTVEEISSGRLERAELADRIRAVVDGLPGAQRDVFVLYEYEGMTYAQIAEVLGRPVGTVKSRMHYALRQIRAGLKRLAGGDE